MYGESHLSNSFNSILPSLVVIEELDTKKRKIRSIRGFLRYALEIIQDEKLITVLETNFQPLFWRRLKDVLRQNKQCSLVQFLFNSSNSTNLASDQELIQLLKEMRTSMEQFQTTFIEEMRTSIEQFQTAAIEEMRTSIEQVAERVVNSPNESSNLSPSFMDPSETDTDKISKMKLERVDSKLLLSTK